MTEMYRILYTRKALRTLRKMPREVAQRVQDRLEQIAKDPFDRHPNVTKLQGRDGYRLRIGDWRVIYELDTTNRQLIVLVVGPRGSVYR